MRVLWMFIHAMDERNQFADTAETKWIESKQGCKKKRTAFFSHQHDFRVAVDRFNYSNN